MEKQDVKMIYAEALEEIYRARPDLMVIDADLARIAGLHICTMGERILRCETAPVVAVTAVMYATGNLS